MKKPTNISKIIIRSPNWVGDVVMATPAFRCIRENFPHAEITIALKSYVLKLIEGAPWFDEVLILDRNSHSKYTGTGNQRLRSLHGISLIKQMRAKGYDLGFLFPNSFSSALMFWLGGVKRRIGYKRDARSWLLTDGVNRLSEKGRFLPTYMGDYYLRLCTAVGCEVQSKDLELFITEESQRRVAEIFENYHLNNGRPLILLNPGAAYGSSKCWTAEGFAWTAELIREQFDCNIVIVCAPNETKLALDIERAANVKLINLASQVISLDVLKALIKKCALLITVDSGPRHIAVAFKRPVVTLMGPNDPRYTGTPAEIGQVIRAEVDCLACHLKVCPKDHRCMTQIKPERVAITSLELLK
ncbi:MAG: lipopolysaccharide heptosyltransferase II [Candidatus Brocadia sp. AMX2]|uniref:lipopolysaccharide heptosyltransferase II n=1 Tax=Candidatus Brocadia sinica JPN1 TaxID=1197129 RepID=A0ABQ0JYH4_9BACT|nr:MULTISPECIES: lipopolysaccharide heptosyltransferase II [Brocadia]MBC6932868.1 lipopolysaccharide heptosyltransferase II [Candidatus Brocadia sp.]MBL1167646.1 lipopolysaccharide heptosyltransferase II [Candidatus Brocadia sp. AMX1]NOG40462.1 lipopolysaccharide heptosyltransferase II [Planctomycetota bacterium]GIK13562.1 MAG: ADP-heptose--LPS heptosyltransferase [Candidatus Brocadia sinica]KAA0242107.1 MAG: lipopolysaccharide heptosyltransferase II [Candidatus Brocadia sp. AMX2]